MKLGKTAETIIIVVISFSIYLFFRQYFGYIKTVLDKITHWGLLSYSITYLIIGIPIFIGTYLINKKNSIWKELGLTNNFIKSSGFAFFFSIPMFVGGFLLFEINTKIIIENLIAGTIIAGFVEELFFRGFLFGQVFKHTQLGFVSSILLGAIVFAMGHLYQSQDIYELIGIFSITFMGAILFAWLYVEWNYNLWVPIFLHTFMNLAWYLFEMDETALGGIIPNIIRGVTILLAIGFTVIYKRKIGKKLIIRKDTFI